MASFVLGYYGHYSALLQTSLREVTLDKDVTNMKLFQHTFAAAFFLLSSFGGVVYVLFFAVGVVVMAMMISWKMGSGLTMVLLEEIEKMPDRADLGRSTIMENHG